MNKFLDISYWRAVARNPAAVTGLAVDLAPIAGVFAWHWGAGALVLLYWFENLIIGSVTLPRILVSSVSKSGVAGLFGGILNGGFFVFHYGMFCMCHGAMLMAFLTGDDSFSQGSDLGLMMARIVNGALGFGEHMVWMLALLAAFYWLVLIRDFMIEGSFKDADPQEEMFAPYGRIMFLHVGIFIIGWALTALGDPMVGAFILILARAFWRFYGSTPPEPADKIEPAAA